MNNVAPDDPLIQKLQNLHTIRLQAHRLLHLASQDKLTHFAYNPDKMEGTVTFVRTLIEQNYPNLDIPYHSRWRHFEMDDEDRIAVLKNKLGTVPIEELGKVLFELVIMSVFLDAGAGPLWKFTEPGSNKIYTRSEGLALASLYLYQNGTFSDHPDRTLRVDANRLIQCTMSEFISNFQVTPDNPLTGLEGRLALLNKLGQTIKINPQIFGEEGRLGNFYTYVCSLAHNNQLSTNTLFHAVLNTFNSIWPVRLKYHNYSLGDVGIHQALKTREPGSEYIPFHKLTQWLTYSLMEPLEINGFKITHINSLTGLPEYRNGGLLIDMGLLTVKNKELLKAPQDPNSEAIVEWRGLTVALLDVLASLIRLDLHQDDSTMPLAKILQGGTWNAGRQIAKQKRQDGTPPITIISDGSIF